MDSAWQSRIAQPSPLPVARLSGLVDRIVLLSGSLPRGKGTIPRLIGRTFFADRLYPSSAAQDLTILWPAEALDTMVSLRRTGNWDHHVLNALLAQGPKSKVFWDVGANAGYMALRFAQANPQTEVRAFEPIPELAGAIARSALHNQLTRLQVLNFALSDARATTTLHVGTNLTHSSMFYETGSRSIEIDLFDADHLIANGFAAPDLIKIDIEGAEMMFFRGAAGMLRRHLPSLVFECFDNPGSHTARDALRYLQSLGYGRFERLNYDGSVEPVEVEAEAALKGGDFRATAAG